MANRFTRNLVRQLETPLRLAGVDVDALVARHLYEREVGRPLNLDDPQSFSEKVSWLKLYGMTPLHSFVADKTTAPAYVEAQIGAGFVVPRLFASHDPAQLTAARIDRPACIVKTSHDSGGVFVVQDSRTADWTRIRSRVQHRMKRNHYRYFRERQYKDLRPGYVVEELLSPDDPEALMNVQVFCFQGQPCFMRCVSFTLDDGNKGNLYAFCLTRDWTPLPFGLPGDTPPATLGLATPARPERLDEIWEIARALSEPFAAVRVDFMVEAEHPFVGELTFAPRAGLAPMEPGNADFEIGAQIDLQAPLPDWQPYLTAAKAHLDTCKLTASP